MSVSLLFIPLVGYNILKSIKSYLLTESSLEFTCAIKEKSKIHLKSRIDKYRTMKSIRLMLR